MAKGEIYVYGSRLYWENINGSRVYSTQGARPSNSSLFSGQSAGRMWVASDTADLALYYSDELGVTRFIQGNDLGATTQTPGNITTRNFLCPEDNGGEYAPDIYWVSQGPSNNRLMQARADGIPDMRFVGVNAQIQQLAGTNNFEYRVWTNGYAPLLETMSFATSSLAPYYVGFYSDASCATPLTDGDGETKYGQLPFGVALTHTNNVMTIPGPPLARGSDPATPWYTTASLNVGSTIDGQAIGSVRIAFPSMSIYANNDLSRVGQRASGSIFCNGPDRIQLNTFLFGFPDSYQCLNLAGTTSTTTTTSTTAPVPRCACEGGTNCSIGCLGAGNPCTSEDNSNCYVPVF